MQKDPYANLGLRVSIPLSLPVTSIPTENRGPRPESLGLARSTLGGRFIPPTIPSWESLVEETEDDVE